MLEQKLEKSRFTRVDSDVVDNLIVKEDKKGETLEANKQDAITTAFKSQLPKMDKVDIVHFRKYRSYFCLASAFFFIQYLFYQLMV